MSETWSNWRLFYTRNFGDDRFIRVKELDAYVSICQKCENVDFEESEKWGKSMSRSHPIMVASFAGTRLLD